MKNTFDIVIVNWNSGTQLRDCIDSINNAKKINCYLNKIIIVDNDSNDDSLQLLKDTDNNSLTILRNKKNFGFAKACNLGARESSSNFILFLNPDCIIFQDTFSNLFEYIHMHDKENIALYGIQLIGEDRKLQKTCARFPVFYNFLNRSLGLNKYNPKRFKSYHMEDWEHDKTQYVDHVIGAFYLVKSKIFKALNGFDESYFVYFEDLDLSKKIHDKGFTTVYVTEAQAYHKGGGTSDAIKAQRLYYSNKSSIIYAFKHLGNRTGIFVMLLYFFEPVTRTIFMLFKHSSVKEIFEMFRGFIILYKDYISILRIHFKR